MKAMARKRQMERHHRLPRSRGGTNHDRNISMVERRHHQAWHLLFSNMEADEVADAITDLWIDPDFYLVAIPRKKKQPRRRRERRYCVDCQCEVMQHIPLKEQPDEEDSEDS